MTTQQVLLIAYACDGYRGSEPGIGWNWAASLAQLGHAVTVVTRADNEASHARWVQEYGPIPFRIHYVQGPRLGRGQVLDNLAWQLAVAAWLRRHEDLSKYTIAHHVTYGSILLGSPLVWQRGLPFVFGPVGGGQVASRATRRYFSSRAWAFERTRSAIVACLPLNPLAKATVRRASLVLASNADTAAWAQKLGAQSVELMPDTGATQHDVRPAPVPGQGELQVIWVGSGRPRKGLKLALTAYSLLAREDPKVALVVVAADSAASSQFEAWRRSDVDGAARARLVGPLAWQDVQDLYRSSSVLLFSSLRESLGSQVLEAMSLGVPVVAPRMHGVATYFDGLAGLVELEPLNTLASRLAGAMADVLRGGPDKDARSAAAFEWCRVHTWRAHAEVATDRYHQIVQRES